MEEEDVSSDIECDELSGEEIEYQNEEVQTRKKKKKKMDEMEELIDPDFFVIGSDQSHIHKYNEPLRRIHLCSFSQNGRKGVWWLQNLCNIYFLFHRTESYQNGIKKKKFMSFLCNIAEFPEEYFGYYQHLDIVIEMFGGPRNWVESLIDWLNKNNQSLMPCMIPKIITE